MCFIQPILNCLILLSDLVYIHFQTIFIHESQFQNIKTKIKRKEKL